MELCGFPRFNVPLWLCNNDTHRPIKTILLKAKKLLDLSLWSDAASQIFYSLGIGFGAIVSFASFTKNCDNVIRDRLEKVQQFTLLLNKLLILYSHYHKLLQ